MMRYVNRFDALRGVCVLAVFAFHAQFIAFGWIGVQIFFVLSGFLITGILCDMKAAGDGAGGFFSIFYARRSLRIFPAYYVALAVISLALLVQTRAVGGLWTDYTRSLPYLLTYTDNFFAITPDYRNSGYFSHLWSLCVEEQFYLLWPLVVWFTPARRLPVICLGVVAVSVTYRIGVVSLDVSDHFRWVAAARLPFTHFDAFAIGALARISPLPARLANWKALWLSALALLVAGIAMHLAARGTASAANITALGWSSHLGGLNGFVWAYVVLNLAAAHLISVLYETRMQRLPWIASFLDSRPMLQLGKLSYAFYIYHDPVMTWLHPYDAASLSMRALLTAVAFFVSLGLAIVSFVLIERPFLSLKRLWRRPGDDAPADEQLDEAGKPAGPAAAGGKAL